MKVSVDRWETSYEGSDFVIEMDQLPRVGELLNIHTSLMNERFFNNEPFIKHPIDIIDDCVQARVTEVNHIVKPEGYTVSISIDFVDI
jgi:hypothetical protein